MSIILIITIVILIVFIIWMVKFLEKELPKKEERLKKDWEKEYVKESLIKHEIDLYEKYKRSNQKRAIISNKEKKKKGEDYEKFIAEHFREQGYYVWEHGKEKGKKDGGIDLFIKKENEAYFVQCKNWESWKINHNTVQAVQTKVRNYMYDNPNLTKLLNGKKKKILYVMPKPILTKSAYAYIKNNSEILDFKIIPMEQKV